MGGLKSQSVGKKWEQEIIDAYYKIGYQPFKIATEIKIDHKKKQTETLEREIEHKDEIYNHLC